MVAHANKDEGLKCLAIAQQALASGNADKAQRFAEKAAKLYPGAETEEFAAKVQRATSGATAATPNGPASSGNGPTGMGASGLRNRQQQQQQQKPNARAATSPRPLDEDHKATPEQRQLVASIRAKTCYYEILGVARAATDDDIKRAYRKLALKLHPDKNKARGADEAFKAVSRAFTCLSDSSKRQQYDVTGSEPDGNRPAGYGGGMQRGGGFTVFDDGFDADEIFRMFFGNNPFMGGGGAAQMYGFGQAARRAQRQRQPHPQQQQQQQRGGTPAEAHPIKVLMMLAPLLILLLVNLFGAATPAFSLDQSRRYSHAMATAAHQVPFYVASLRDFDAKYPLGSRARTRVEYSVEQEWRDAMQQRCYQERLTKRRFEYYGHKAKAAAMTLRSCTELQTRFAQQSQGGAAAAS